MVSVQHYDRLQLTTRRLVLTRRCCKDKWQVTDFLQVVCEVDHFIVGNNLDACSSFVRTWCKGWQGNVALFFNYKRANCNFLCIVRSTHYNLAHVEGMWRGALSPWQTDICLPIFCCLRLHRAIGHCCPLVHLKMHRLRLLACRLKNSLQLITYKGDEKGSNFPKANKYLFTNLLLFGSGEGDDTMSPSFATKNIAIDATTASLEVLLAIYNMQVGCEGDHFANGKRLLVCQSFVLFWSFVAYGVMSG